MHRFPNKKTLINGMRKSRLYGGRHHEMLEESKKIRKTDHALRGLKWAEKRLTMNHRKENGAPKKMMVFPLNKKTKKKEMKFEYVNDKLLKEQF